MFSCCFWHPPWRFHSPRWEEATGWMINMLAGLVFQEKLLVGMGWRRYFCHGRVVENVLVGKWCVWMAGRVDCDMVESLVGLGIFCPVLLVTVMSWGGVREIFQRLGGVVQYSIEDWGYICREWLDCGRLCRMVVWHHEWGSYFPPICLRGGGREDGIFKKKPWGSYQLVTSGFVSARCSPCNGGTLGVTSHQVSGTTEVVPYCI